MKTTVNWFPINNTNNLEKNKLYLVTILYNQEYVVTISKYNFDIIRKTYYWDHHNVIAYAELPEPLISNDLILWLDKNIEPSKKDSKYLVSISVHNEIKTTIGSYNFDIFKQKYQWIHDTIISYAELPEPFKN
jgi:hypothetical protein